MSEKSPTYVPMGLMAGYGLKQMAGAEAVSRAVLAGIKELEEASALTPTNVIRLLCHDIEIVLSGGLPKLGSPGILILESPDRLLGGPMWGSIGAPDLPQRDRQAMEAFRVFKAAFERIEGDESLKASDLEQVLSLVIPINYPTDAAYLEALSNLEGQNALMGMDDWLTSAQLGVLAGHSTRNLSAEVSRWKKRGQIFSVNWQGTQYFPKYGLDQDNAMRPWPAMATILSLFDDRSSWATAGWFASVNSYLGGTAPKDLLANHPERVIAAARDSREGVQHG